MRNPLAGQLGADALEEGEQARFGMRELRVLWPHLRRHLRYGVGALLLLVVAQAGALATPFLIRYGIDSGILAGDHGALSLAAGLVAAAAVVNWFALKAAMLLGGRFGEAALRDIRIEVFDHMSHLDLAFFEREKTGRLVARLTSDVETIEILVTEGLVSMVAQAMYFVGAVAVLFTMDPLLAAVSLAACIPLMVVSTAVFRVRSERAYRRVRERIASVLTFMQETVRGVQVVQAFGREGVNAHRFRRVNEDWRVANVDSMRPGAVFFPLIELIGVLGTAVVLGYGGWRTAQGDLSVGVLTLFVLYLSTTLEPIQQLSQLYDTFQQAMAGLARLAALFERRASVVESQQATDLTHVDGSAGVDDVTFRYQPDLPDALSDVTLEVAPGEVLALVGPTGAGKSTIAKLLLRFYDPTAGSIRLGDNDLRAISFASLRRLTSMVPQEAFLFRGTISHNIRFGRPDASDEEVTRVCELLGIHEAILRLPEGYDTQVRERGAALSGGERQLIALARALMVDPRLIVLDEATSALDSATEARVEQALGLAVHGRTTIVIAHRLSTAARATRVAVVDHGRILEVGTHDDLVRKEDGLYARLYEHWLEN